MLCGRVASRSVLTVGLVGLETGESITFKRKRRLNLSDVLDGVVFEILQFSVDRELERATVACGLSWRCRDGKSRPRGGGKFMRTTSQILAKLPLESR